MSAAKRKYKPYPKYKDSGVEWLGQVPEHWEVKPLWAVADCNREKLRDDEEPDTEIDYVDISAVTYEGGILSSQPLLFGNAPSRARRRAERGDIAISTVRTYLKAVAEVTEEFSHCVFSTGFAVVHPRQQVHQPFLRWIIPSGSFVSAVESHSEGVSYPAINAADLMKLKIVLPPNSDCQSIADFIERECGRMDKLVEKKQEFIALLKEKRQALITHAVTKGLDPKAAMKDSGVEWLGRVPKHWDVKRLKYLVSLGRDKTSESIEGKTFVGLEDVPSCEGRYAPTSTESRITETGTVNLFYRGSVLYGKLRPYLCKVMIADFDGACSTEFLVLHPNDSVRASWIRNWLLTPELTQQIESGCEGAKMPRADWDHVGGLPLPCQTDPAEADAIADHIYRETTRIDRLIAKTIESIDLLKERKTALITAAVTGQIDVSQSA